MEAKSKVPDPVSKYLSDIGKTGGSKTSSNKAASSASNGKNGMRPHFRKVKHFLKVFPLKLDENEWKVKFPMVINGKKTTYNPDYFCPSTGYYIEVTTSGPNISEQGKKWAEAIRLGHKLKVFWWEGNEITRQIVRQFTSKRRKKVTAPSAVK